MCLYSISAGTGLMVRYLGEEAADAPIRAAVANSPGAPEGKAAMAKLERLAASLRALADKDADLVNKALESAVQVVNAVPGVDGGGALELALLLPLCVWLPPYPGVPRSSCPPPPPPPVFCPCCTGLADEGVHLAVMLPDEG